MTCIRKTSACILGNLKGQKRNFFSVALSNVWNFTSTWTTPFLSSTVMHSVISRNVNTVKWKCGIGHLLYKTWNSCRNPSTGSSIRQSVQHIPHHPVAEHCLYRRVNARWTAQLSVVDTTHPPATPAHMIYRGRLTNQRKIQLIFTFTWWTTNLGAELKKNKTKWCCSF